MRVLALLVSGDGHYDGIPGANPPYESLAPLALLLASAAVITAIGIMSVTGLEEVLRAVALRMQRCRPAAQSRMICVVIKML
jgi:hypothetical protein